MSTRDLFLATTALCLVLCAASVLFGVFVSRALRQRDAVLHQQEAHLRAALEVAPVGVLIVDETGRCDLVNHEVERLFGHRRSALLGQPVEQLLPAEARHRHVAHRAQFAAAPSTREMGPGRELWAQRADGERFVVEVGLSPLLSARGAFTLCTVVDVSARRRVTQRLEAAVREQQALLREVHHRVKNNLQVISSLLGLQAAHAATEVRGALEDSRDRVHAIASVHEQLCREDASAVVASTWLPTLVGELVTALRGSAVEVNVDAAPLRLSVDEAVPLGLIVNELVTNAFKHALSRGGRLRVALEALDPTRARLSVVDEGGAVGTGAPAGVGLKLVGALARQLDGEFSFDDASGHRASLVFTRRA